MKVLINAFSARQGGGQTYLHNLLSFLPPENTAQVFVLAPESLLLPQTAHITRIRVRWPVENPFLRAIWEKTRLVPLIRKLGVDVLFCPGGTVGARAPDGCKTVTMFRNMIPFDRVQRRKYPLGYQRLRNWLLEKVLLKSMLRADLVIFISGFARKVIENRARGRLHASVTIPHGVNPHFRVGQDNKPARPAWLPPDNYLLYVSTLDFYKAQVEVLQGYALLNQRRVTREKLILAGPANPAYARKVRAEIGRLGLTDHVIVAGEIPYRELPGVYHHALINIFASESENCPNILLEALAAGRPIVCSNRSPMPEFGADAVLYFDPAAPHELADQLSLVIDHPALQTQLAAKAGERAGLYDWHQTARLTWQAIENLHGQHAQP